MFFFSFTRPSSARAAIRAAFCRVVPDGSGLLSTPEGLANLKDILLDTGGAGSPDEEEKIRLFLLHLLRTDAADGAFTGVHPVKHHLSVTMIETALTQLDKVVSEVLEELVKDRDIVTRLYVREMLPGLARAVEPRGGAKVESALDVFKAVARHEPLRLEEDFPDAVELCNLILQTGFRIDVQPSAFVLRPHPPQQIANGSILGKLSVAEFLTAAKGVEATLYQTGFSPGVSEFAGVAKVYGALMNSKFPRSGPAIEQLPFLKQLLAPPPRGQASLALSTGLLQRATSELKFIFNMGMAPTHKQCDLVFSVAAVSASTLMAAYPQRYAAAFPVLIPLLFPHGRNRASQTINVQFIQTALSTMDGLVSVFKLHELSSFRAVPDVLPDVLAYLLSLNRFFAGAMPGIDWVHTLRGNATGARTPATPFFTGARQVLHLLRKADSGALLSADCMTALSEAAPHAGVEVLTPSLLYLLSELITASRGRRDDHLNCLIKTLLNIDDAGFSHPSPVAVALLWDPKRALATALATKLSMFCGGLMGIIDHARHVAAGIIIDLFAAASPGLAFMRTGDLRDIPRFREEVTDIILFLYSHTKWSEARFGSLRKLLAYHAVCHYPGSAPQLNFQHELGTATNQFDDPTWLRATVPLLTRIFAALGCLPTGPPPPDSFGPFVQLMIDTLEAAADSIRPQLPAVARAVDVTFRTTLDDFGERRRFMYEAPDWTDPAGFQLQSFVQPSALQQFSVTMNSIAKFVQMSDVARAQFTDGAVAANVEGPRPPLTAPPRERPAKRPRLGNGAGAPPQPPAGAEVVSARDPRLVRYVNQRVCIRSLSVSGCPAGGAGKPPCPLVHLRDAELDAAKRQLSKDFPRKFVFLGRRHFRQRGGK